MVIIHFIWKIKIHSSKIERSDSHGSGSRYPAIASIPVSDSFATKKLLAVIAVQSL
jgi:hypothetical protein